MNCSPGIERVRRRCTAVRAGWTALVALAACIGLACSGGVDSGGTGMEPANVAIGPVTGFGSIVVAGIHHDESQATIVDDDDRPLSADALQLGMMATVEGSPVTANGSRLESTAWRVRIGERVLGPLEGVDADGLGLVVLGQRVVVTPATVLDVSFAAGLAALPSGTVLVVHGQFDAARAVIVATRIEPRPAATDYILTAVVTRYDRATLRLTLGGLEVDLTPIPPASLPVALPAGALARVKLQPVRSGALWSATALRAVATVLADRDNVEIEGRITAFASAQDFSVDGVPVDARAAAFPNGTAGLAIGVRVEVEGRTVAGTLVARTVAIEPEGSADGRDFELEGRISALDVAAATFVVRGITVSYGGTPRFEGGTAADLALDRRVSVKGRLSADRTKLDATSIHIER